jgi:hypothetical protein
VNELAAVASIIALALALPGLIARRFGPWPARAIGFAVALTIAFVALDRRATVDERLPARTIVVPTSGRDGEAAALVARLRGRGIEATALAGPGPLEQRLAEATLIARGEAEVVLLWDGHFPVPAAGAGAASRPRLAAVSRRPVLEFDEQGLAARVLSAAERQRPLSVEVVAKGLARLGPNARITCTVTEPGGRVIGTASQGAADALASGQLAVSCLPEQAGSHVLSVRIELPDALGEVLATGSFEVAEPRHVAVVGPGGEEVAEALRTQGVAARALADLPAAPEEYVSIVLLARQPHASQARLLEYVDRGGGLLVVGGPHGGALPAAEEPLAKLLPVRRLESREPSEDQPGGTGPGKPRPEPPPPERKPDAKPPPPAPSQPEASEPKPPPPGKPDAPAATGDTSGAKAKDPTPHEVERRSVAMVLVLDVSGSMDEPARVDESRTKIEYAKQSTFVTAQALQPGDQVALVTFGEHASVEVPLSPAERLERFRQKIEGVRADQRTTNVTEALVRARRELQRSDCAVKHVVVVTDGEIFDFLSAYRELRLLHAEGVTTSLIQILGSGTMQSQVQAQRFATAGGGTYATPQSGAEVPRIVSAEVRTQLAKVGRQPRGEGTGAGAERPRPDAPPPTSSPTASQPTPPSLPQPPPESQPEPPPESKPQPRAESRPGSWPVRALVESRLLRPEPKPAFPELTGLVECAAAPDAYVLLVAGSRGLPLLAFGNRGLGKVGAFTCDLSGPWSQAFRAEGGYPARLSQWVAYLAPVAGPESGPALALRLEAIPDLPTQRESAWLQAIAGSRLGSPEALAAPGPALRSREHGTARELAVTAALAMLVQALVEFAISLIAIRSGSTRSS